MYNNLVKELLAEVKKEDSNVFSEQQKYSVWDKFSTIEIYISESMVSYRVFGDAYIVAMAKWIQNKIQKKEDLRKINIESIILDFELPEVKYRNALQLIELIEKVNEGTTI
ncbi:hypothetical protein LO80_02810 [Candidatus Francisella endociliophora]|uniref:NIF system FeS cluster assembly NifU N-terminal domain-containing protein n=1 Tax=Candidatus Francisella endociliophora TaxID=653937 RepID=A0A097EN72_9GAMM|nr:hypothetical protein [Francisella sp. FSC1006]AIT09012.1 hypothetical protein LO80_02810 [Francisella sp. FSC1006]